MCEIRYDPSLPSYEKTQLEDINCAFFCAMCFVRRFNSLTTYKRNVEMIHLYHSKIHITGHKFHFSFYLANLIVYSYQLIQWTENSLVVTPNIKTNKKKKKHSHSGQSGVNIFFVHRISD